MSLQHTGAPRLRLTPIACAVYLALGSAVMVGSPLALAQQSAAAIQQYDIPAGPLAEAVNRFAQQAGVSVVMEAGKVANLRSPGLQGSYGVDAGFALLLKNTGYMVQKNPAGYVLVPVPKPVSGEQVLPTVPVVAAAPSAEALPKAYAGGQVARGARLGMLGNKDFMDVPFSATSYTAELMEDRAALTLGDALANDVTVRNTTSSGHMYENFRMRGFNLNSSELAFNGLYGLSPNGHVPTEFLERVEVIRGPSALFSGITPGGGVGGTVNLVSKRAGDDPLTRVTMDYTTDSQVGTYVDVGRRFGEDKQFGVRINGAYRDGDTAMNDQSKTRDLWSVGLDYRGERGSLSLDVYNSKEKYKGGTPAMFWFAPGVSPLSPPDANLNQFRGLFGQIESRGLMARGEYEINEALTAYAALGTMRYDYSGFLNGTHVRSMNSAGTSTTTISNGQRGYDDNASMEAGIRGNFATGPVNHQVVVNASVVDLKSGAAKPIASATYTTNMYNPTAATVAAVPGSVPFKTSDATLSSVAVADTLGFFDDRVQLTLGLRNQQIRTKAFSDTTGAMTSRYDKSAVTPAVGLVVKPWGPSLSLYANEVEGFSQGGTVTDNTATNYLQQFAPYRTEQSEVGVKWDGGSFTHTVALFDISKPSMIKEGNTYTDQGKQNHRGLEWNGFGEVSRNVRLLGGASYILSTLSRNATTSAANNGHSAVGVPKWQAVLGAEWDLPWMPGLTLTGRATYTDRLYLDAANKLEIPSWTQYDVGARYSTKIQERKVVFRANVINLFDRDYWTGSFSDSNAMATLSAPRTVTLSATVDF